AASSTCGLPATAAIGYTFTAAAASGNATPSTAPPAAATSVTYTRPASASPVVTLASTSVTDRSSLTGDSSTPARRATRCVAAPHGTSGAQTTTSRSPARSARPDTSAGLPAGTAIRSVLD